DDPRGFRRAENRIRGPGGHQGGGAAAGGGGGDGGAGVVRAGRPRRDRRGGGHRAHRPGFRSGGGGGRSGPPGDHRGGGVRPVTMPEISHRLRDALVEAYGPHVRSRVDEPDAGLDDALDMGLNWLMAALTELLSQPFSQQRRGPLEVFQEAMRFPSDYLAAPQGPPPPRDPVAVSALPGDIYDLAPASTRDLGDEVWSIHLSWGAAKAAAIMSGGEPAAGET